MKRWIIGCLSIMIILSGCSIRMTTEERLSLYGDNSIQIMEGEEGIQMEQLVSNQVPQFTVNWEDYSLETVGSLFLGLSKEETEQKLQEYYEYLFQEQNLTKEQAEEIGATINLSRGDAYISVTPYSGMRFRAFSEAERYGNMFYSACRLYRPNENIIDSMYTLHYRHLSSAFSTEELESGSKDRAKAVCNPIAAALGFSEEEMKIYTMDAQSMNRIQEITGLASLDTKIDENGNIIGELKPWTTEQGVYLLLYKKAINGKIVESVTAENILFLVYHPEKGVILAEAQGGKIGSTIINESMQTVISAKEAVAEARICFLQLNQGNVTIRSAKLKYMLPMGNLNYSEKQMIIEPCWDVEYEYMKNGIKLIDHILIHGVTGMEATGEIQF